MDRAARRRPAELDFLELSLRAAPDRAPDASRRFAESLREHDIEPDPAQETKTRLVLDHLATTYRTTRPDPTAVSG